MILKDVKFSSSITLIKNTKYFFNIKYSFFNNIFSIKNGIFYGWGRKKSGRKAIELSKKYNTSYKLLEDGFIRSLGLGVNGSPSFSIVEDDIGIFYDATLPSKLENILNHYDFDSDKELIKTANQAMKLIKKYHISKYNNACDVDDSYFTESKKNRVLVIAQTAGDMSLKYGLGDDFTTDEIIKAAIEENPDSTIYLKVHPDVLSGKKDSDLNVEQAKKLCIVIEENVNPISLLKHFDKVYTKTSQMGFEALLVGCKCVCFGMPFYAGWGITEDKLESKRRKRNLNIEEVFAAAYILYTKYFDPYINKESNIIDTIEAIKELKDNSNNNKKHFFFGFSYWKRKFIKTYFPYIESENIVFISSLFNSNEFEKALDKGLNENSDIYIWGRREYPQVQEYVKEKSLNIYRIEDGFIRSVGLGSDLTQPYSLVIDSRGIYFDPTSSSDLEHIISTSEFDENIIKRAKKLKNYLIEKKLSKYNLYENKTLDIPKDKKIVVVPGQVEDDASIQYGASGMTNLELLKQARNNAKDAYLIYKPHPDVLVGNRVGHIDESEALKYADRIVTEVGLDSVLEISDEVHTMTSLVGFEALMREKKVFTYGVPFYAGWGLTVDSKGCERRDRKISIDELVAATLIMYPKYIHPKDHSFCKPEELLEELDKQRKLLKSSLYLRVKMNIRNYISRKPRAIWRNINTIYKKLYNKRKNELNV